MNFLWTTIHVKDLEASKEFYTKMVELEVEREFASPTGNVICFLGKGETKFELIYNPKDTIEIGKSISVGFQVDSVDEKIKSLAEVGIEVYEGPIEPNPTIKFFYVLDPNGLKVQFVERR